MSSIPRDITLPAADREQALRDELKQAYGHLSDITSRLLLANEAAEAALSSHERTVLADKFLEVAASGTEVRRAALFLVEGSAFSVGATLGLAEDEQEELASSQGDIEACRDALDSRAPLVLDPDLVTEDAVRWAEANRAAAEEDEEEPEEEEGEDADDEEASGAGEPTGAAMPPEIPTAARAAPDRSAAPDGSPAPDAPTSTAPFFGVYLPVHLEDAPTAVLALGQRTRGRRYGEDEMVFLAYLLRQFAVALNRSFLMEKNAERLQELDALLKVSRAITSTLDLDSVLRAVVNTVAAVVENERAEIVLLRGGRLQLRAVSGMTRLDPDQVQLFRLGGPLEYLALHRARLHLGADDLGAEPAPPGADVFGEYFGTQEMRSFMALPLKDDQGLLGFLCIESRQESWDLEPAEGDALDILAAQTSVAIRNAMLYSEIPLRGVARPVSKLRSKLLSLDPRGRVALAVASALAALLLVLPVFPERAGGPAEVRPLRFQRARAATEGVIAEVLVRGGEEVAAGQPLARLEDLDLAGRIAQLTGDIEVLQRAVAAAQRAGDIGAWRSGQIRLSALERTLEFEQRRARGALLVAPFAGQVLELDLSRQLGQHKEAGETFCTVAALDSMTVDVSVSEEKIGRVRLGQPVAVKVQAYPTRTFHGRVTEMGWRGEPDARNSTRFLVRAVIANSGRALRPGMTGVAKATVSRRPLAALAVEPFARAIQLGWW